MATLHFLHFVQDGVPATPLPPPPTALTPPAPPAIGAPLSGRSRPAGIPSETVGAGALPGLISPPRRGQDFRRSPLCVPVCRPCSNGCLPFPIVGQPGAGFRLAPVTQRGRVREAASTYGEWHGSWSKGRSRPPRSTAPFPRVGVVVRHPQPRHDRRAIDGPANEDARGRRQLQGLEEQACLGSRWTGTDYLTIGDMLTGPGRAGHPRPTRSPAAKVAVDFAKTNDKFEIVGGAMGATAARRGGREVARHAAVAGRTAGEDRRPHRGTRHEAGDHHAGTGGADRARAFGVCGKSDRGRLTGFRFELNRWGGCPEMENIHGQT